MKVTEIRWLDVTVWHKGKTETVEESELIPDEDEQIPEEGEPVDGELPEELTAISAVSEPEVIVEGDPTPAETEDLWEEVIPAGVVEITVEGLSEDGLIWVYHVGDDGAVEKIDANVRDGNVIMTIGLN